MTLEEFVIRGHRAQTAANQAQAEWLVGRQVKFAHLVNEAQTYRVTRAVGGLVELEGWYGRFAPELFITVVLGYPLE